MQLTSRFIKSALISTRIELYETPPENINTAKRILFKHLNLSADISELNQLWNRHCNLYTSITDDLNVINKITTEFCETLICFTKLVKYL